MAATGAAGRIVAGAGEGVGVVTMGGDDCVSGGVVIGIELSEIIGNG